MRKEKLEELKSYIEELRTIKRVEVKKYSIPFITIIRQKLFLNNGKVIIREKILKGKKDGSAAIVLPITNKNNTVLIVQPRVFTKKTVGVELPAGYIERGEKNNVSALRELKEETGYVSNDIIEIGEHYQDPGCSSALNHSFIAFNCERVGEQSLDKDEYIRFFECTYDEALELLDMEYINDANSIITLEKSKKYIRR